METDYRKMIFATVLSRNVSARLRLNFLQIISGLLWQTLDRTFIIFWEFVRFFFINFSNIPDFATKVGDSAGGQD